MRISLRRVAAEAAAGRRCAGSLEANPVFRARTSAQLLIVGQAPGRRVHDPKHPQADADGYVTYSNVNAVEEMVNMISASRSYQNNVEVMNTAKTLLLKTLQMGQS